MGVIFHPTYDGINNNIGCEPSIAGFILSIPRKSLANH
jgi:hypothetical protein